VQKLIRKIVKLIHAQIQLLQNNLFVN